MAYPKFRILVLLCASVSPSHAQQVATLAEPAYTAPSHSSGSLSSSTAVVSTPTVSPASTQRYPALDRWVDISAANFSWRYRSETASSDFRYFANWQQRSLMDGRLKADREGRYALNFHLSSGRAFNWAYSDVVHTDFAERVPASLKYLSPLQQHRLFSAIYGGYPLSPSLSRGWQENFRQFYVSATPVDSITAEYGSLAIERGESTEITTYDDDGYLTGERLRFHAPRTIWLDEVAVTYAFEGDLQTPNFFSRAHHLKNSNYHQFLAAKHFSDRVKASVDYTYDQATHTIREAALIQLPETKVLDSVRAEFYERANARILGPLDLKKGSGFGVTMAKSLFHKKLALDGGYETVDSDYGATQSNVISALSGFSMNGDSYSTGNHLFTHARVSVSPYITVSGFYVHQTASQPAASFGFAKEGFNAAMNFDLKKIVERPAHAL